MLRRWEVTLDALESDARSLVGTLDWVTKRFLLEHAPHDASHPSLKKIDLKYHELSPDGYHRVLIESLEDQDVLEVEDVQRAMPRQLSSSQAPRGLLPADRAGSTLD